MSTNDVTMQLKVIADTRQAEQQAERLEQKYSRAVNPVSKSTYQSGQGKTKTARSIGQGAGTGSSASDFAAQAQGLGGLVHLYATFAANIYAASAAFGALKEAMNTAHLVQGLDQLSAASGRNLGILAKQLNNVTDGALSLKESMTSVANSAAMGMTNKQILQMGEVAKKASQALGWDMADAMDRLTKGIGKNRPQLLDELGILVNANTVYSDYARSVGKTTATLTDFEKKQAFANAVLQQGLDKFGVIDIPTNPFNKLEAAASNTMQSLLGLIDKGVGPIVKYLAESPTGLALAMGGIATMLVKQAIPAIGAYRESLAKAAAASRDLLQQRSDARFDRDLSKLSVPRDEVANQIASKQKELVSSMQTLSGIRKATIDRVSGDSVSWADELEKRKGALSSLNTQLKNSAGDIKANETLQQKIALTNTHIAQIQELIVLESKLAEKNRALDEASNIVDKRGSLSGPIQQALLDRQKQSTNRAQITSNASEITSKYGLMAGLSGVWKDITNKEGPAKEFDETGKAITRMGNQASWFTKIAGGLSGSLVSIGTALSEVMSFIAPYIMAFTALAMLYGAFDSYASKATEQQDKFNTSIENGISSVKVAGDVLDFLAKKTKDAISIDSIQAMTNAMSGLTDSISSQIESIEKWSKAAGTWDNIKDGFASIFGNSNAQILAKNLGKEIYASFDTMVFTPGLEQRAKEGLAGVLHVKPEDLSSAQAITKIIQQGKDSSDYAIISRAKEAEKFLNTIKEEDAASTSAVKSFADSLKEVDKELDTITNKIQFKDGLGKLGLQIEDLANKMSLAMQNPLKAFETLLNMAQDPKLLGALQAFGTGSSSSSITSAVPALKEIQASLSSSVKSVADAKSDIETSKAKGEYTTTRQTSYIDPKDWMHLITVAAGGKTKEGSNLDEVLKVAEQGLSIQMDRAITLQDQIFKPLTENLIKSSTVMIDTALKNAQGMASLSMATTDLSIAQKAGLVTADREKEIKLKELGYKQQELEASYKLQLAIIDNTEALEKASAQAVLQSDKATTPEKQQAGRVIKKYADAEAIRSGTYERGGTSGAKDAKAEEDRLFAAKSINLSRERAAKGMMAAEAQIGAEKYAIIKKAELDLELQKLAVKQATSKVEADTTSAALDQLSYQEKLAQGYDSSLSNARTELEILKAEQDYYQQNQSLDARQTVLDHVKLDSSSKTYAIEKASFDTKVQDLANERKIAATKLDTATASAELAKTLRDQAASTDRLTVSQSTSLRILNETNNTKKLTNDQTLQSLGFEHELGNISDSLYNTQKDALELSNRSLAYESAKTAAISDQTIARKQYNDLLNTKGASDDATVKAKEALDAKTGIVSKLEEEFKASNKIAEAAAKHRDILKDQADIMTAMSGLFGQLGTDISNAAKAMSNFAAQSKANAEAIAAAKDSDKPALRLKAQKDEAMGYALMASSAKKMFKEKSAGYKMMDQIEQAAYAYRMAMDAKELAFKLESYLGQIAGHTAAEIEKTAATEAGFASRIGTYISEIMASWSSIGPWGAVAAAAFIAANFAGANAGSGATAADTAEGQQKLGAGQSYAADGNTVVQNGRGVLGDSSAKSDSIKKSLETIKNTSVEYLTIFNPMLTALENIDSHMNDLATAIIKTTGLNKTGGGFGIKEGETTSKAMNIAGMDTSWLGLGTVINKLFSSSETTKIENQGLKFKGTFDDILHGVSGSIQNFATVTTEWSHGFWDKGTNVQDMAQNVSDPIKDAVSNIFYDAQSVFVQAGKQFGISEQTIIDGLGKVKLPDMLSLKDLKPEEQSTAIQNYFSNVFDIGAEKVVPMFEKFQIGGEGLFETVTRVMDGGYKLTAAFDSIGKSSASFADGINGLNQSEGLIKAAGGVDILLGQIKQFGDDFLSESERLAPVQKMVGGKLDSLGEQFQGLGISSKMTRDEFKNLILTLDTSDPSKAKLFEELMKLEPAFNAVTKSATKVREVLDTIGLSDAKLQQTIKIYELLGNSEAGLALTRQAELATMDQRLVNTQLYIYALEDEQTLKNKLLESYNKQKTAIQGTIDSLRASIKTLQDYKSALFSGDKSMMNPSEKYAQSKDTLEKLKSIISGPAITEDDKKKQADAISKLPAASDAFLTASKGLYATSAQYTTDFQSVADFLNASDTALSQQLSDAEKQLKALDDQYTMLGLINTALTDDNSLIGRYLSAIQATAAAKVVAQNTQAVTDTPVNLQPAASGGYRQGITLVGEQGPEIVDFKNPGRVYSNTASNDLLNLDPLVAELQALRQEVATLRAEQKEQTGHLISTNYDANLKAASEVADANEQITKQVAWAERSKVKLA